MTFRLAGRVVRSIDLAPLNGLTVRFIAQEAALEKVPNVEVLPAGQVDWTGTLTGFAGSRWDCWEQHIDGKVPITWADFSAGALSYNPHLASDGRLYQANKSYLVPEVSPPKEAVWTGMLTGFAGSRWDCWEKHINGKVPITWPEFMDGALTHNPQLSADGRVFKAEKTYVIPEIKDTCRAAASAVTDADGRYTISGIAPGTRGILEVSASGYTPLRLGVVINGDIDQPITLNGGGVGVRSALPNYSALPPKVRAIIDQALSMLGDERTVYDSLPPKYQQMCYGAQFLNQPNSMYYKDIVCADLVSICLAAAGFSLNWSNSGSNPHMAHFYMPGPSSLQEITDANDWRPGDVLVYGNHGAARAGHVNIYVGPFQGVDRSGLKLPLSANYDVVESSMNFTMNNGQQWGRGNIAATRAQCLQGKRSYQWVRRVRLKEVAALF